jgi:hypothetical protein
VAAKRMTSTGKWDQAWFRKLSPQLKCAWMFLCDRCDHAGIWDIDLDAMAFFIGVDLSLDEIEKAFGERIKALSETKLLVCDFVDFQYGELNPDNRVHKSVLNRLEKEGAIKGLKRPLEGAKDKDKNKDKDKDKDNTPELNFKTAQDLIDFLPTELKKNWIAEFDEDWLISEINACYEYYSLTRPDKKPKTSRGWRSAAGGWIRRSRNKVLKLQRNAGDISPGVA